MSNNTIVPCWVYKSERRPDTYLYLAKEDDFESIPTALRDAMGELELVMGLALHSSRKLASADVERVMRELVDLGFYLQLPPKNIPFEGPSLAQH